MSLCGWGNYPRINNKNYSFSRQETLRNIIEKHEELIPYGNGRSYGDSALNTNIVRVRPYNFFLDFDSSTGLLHLQAGVLLSEILDAFVHRGWFLKITPGTKLITIGGAIASDVHGKNHHIEGCFSECVETLNLMLPDGKVVGCSKKSNSGLFKATCGGMGLTGVILDAKISLKKINSKYIDQTTIKTRNLQETFDVFEQYKHSQYSVAWIDSLAKGEKLGRCLLVVGDFCDDGSLLYEEKRKFNIAFNFPSFTLNKISVRIFNALYYAMAKKGAFKQKVDLDRFFFPLDAIGNWNRIYGKKGFTQYQFILPKETSFRGLEEILKFISKSGRASFLAVLKLYGKANDNYLSFPMEGYSLALDFRMDAGLLAFFEKLDLLVLKYGGRFYLAKDARVCQAVFEQGYPHIEKFRAVRKKFKMYETFNSLQSRRVGI